MDGLTIRRTLKEKRRALSKDQITDMSNAVYKNFLTLSIDAKTCFIYKDFNGEVLTTPFIEYFKSLGSTISYPFIKESDMFAVIPNNNEFKRNLFGVEEPNEFTITNDIEVAIIPLIACDENKNRLGFGKGYYDKFLRDKTCLKIGICYDFQVLDNVPTHELDVPLDIIITDKRIIK